MHFPLLPVCVRADWEAVGPPERPICIPVKHAFSPNRLGRRSINTKPDATKEGRKRSVCTRQGFMEHGVRSSLSNTAWVQNRVSNGERVGLDCCLMRASGAGACEIVRLHGVMAGFDLLFAAMPLMGIF